MIDVAFAEVGAHVDEVFVTALVVVRVGLASLLVVAATVVIVLSKKHQVILLKTIKLKMLYFHSLQNQPSITAEKPFTKPPTKTESNVINLVFYDAKMNQHVAHFQAFTSTHDIGIILYKKCDLIT